MIPFVKRHEDQVMTCLMILPIALLVAGLVGTVVVVIKKNSVTPDRTFRERRCPPSRE